MKYIIFDWSGVVKDALSSQVWLVNRIFTKHGAENLTVEEFKENWEQPYDLFYKKYLPDLSLEEESRDYKEAILSAECPKSESFTEVVELIKTLKKKGHYLAVVSSDFPETVFKEMKEYGLEGIFDDVVTDVHDKTESVAHLIEKNDLKLSDTYFIGDSSHEIQISNKLGINGIGVTWGFCTEAKLRSHNPNFIATTPKELEAILL